MDEERAYSLYTNQSELLLHLNLNKLMDDVSTLALRRYINKQLKASCPACHIDDPSQQHHLCLTAPWIDTVDKYFGHAFDLFSEDFRRALYSSIYTSVIDMPGKVIMPDNYNYTRAEVLARVQTDTNIQPEVQNAVNTYFEKLYCF